MQGGHLEQWENTRIELLENRTQKKEVARVYVKEFDTSWILSVNGEPGKGLRQGINMILFTFSSNHWWWQGLKRARLEAGRQDERYRKQIYGDQ